MNYFKNELIHTSNCHGCCKEYCTNCYSISLSEIILLIEQLEDQILINSEGWMNKKKYDFKSCYSKDIHLVSSIYLRTLKRYKNSLISGGKPNLKKRELNKVIENVKDIISICTNVPSEVISLQIDYSNYDVWAEANPIYAALPVWEIAPEKTPIITYTTRLDYDSLVDCNISYNTYIDLKACNLTHELIQEIIGCNMITETNIESSSCPIIEVKTNMYPLCDLVIDHTLQEQFINDLKEIKLIE